MHICRICPADFSALADISFECFWHDELYDFTNALKVQYPNDFRDSFLRRCRLYYNTPGFVINIAVTDVGDTGHQEGGRVVGYAVWCRNGTSSCAQRWHKDTFPKALERALLNLTDSYISIFHLDESLNQARRKLWLANSQESFPAIQEFWKLVNLCVLPAFQRRGIADLLIDWGKDRAIEESCPIGLSSSAKGVVVYSRADFRKYGTLRVKDFPVEDVPLFLWEPPGLEGLFGMRDDEVISINDT